MYPRLIINLRKIQENYQNMEKDFNNEITIFPVVKSIAGDLKIVDALIKANAKYLADSRIENLKKFANFRAEKVLLRIPMLSEVDLVVKYANISLNSELKTIQALNEAAKMQGIIHQIIIMIDIGDLREGIYFKNQSEIYHTFKEVVKLENIRIFGIGTNITCYGGVLPTTENLQLLVNIKEKIESDFKIKIPIISGGNSSSCELFFERKFPRKINNLRIGEALFLGKETVHGNFLQKNNYPNLKYSLHNDAIILEAELVEVKLKDSVPTGKIGLNSFGEVPKIQDKGKIIRGIAAIGKQDVHHTQIKTLDENVEIIDSSSDHLLLDLTKTNYQVGDILRFSLTYGSLVSSFTSQYVKKEYID